MPMGRYRLRENFLSILAAALVCVVLERIWIIVFMKQWLSGMGHDHAWLSDQHLSGWLLYATALLAAVVIAATIEAFTRLTGAPSVKRGIEVAVTLWLGLVMTTQATQFVFERGAYSLFAINAGFWLIGFVAMGAIVGGWKNIRSEKSTR